MEPYTIFVAGSGLFVAGLLKGTTGLGYSSCALPFVVLAVGLHSAIALIIAPAIASNVALILRTGHIRETIVRFAWLYAAMVPGILVGVGLLINVNASLATRVLGMITLGFVFLAWIRPSLSLSHRAEGLLQVPVGFTNGLLTGLTGSQILPLLPFMLSLHLDNARFVQAVNLAVTFASLVVAIGFAAHNLMTAKLFALSLAGIVPAISGVVIGDRIRSRLPEAFFRRLVLVVLGGLGLLLISRGSS